MTLALAGCATQKSSTQPTVQMRACEACRADLDACQRRAQQETTQPCMDEFMQCLRMQSLEAGQCAGAN